MNDYVHNRLKRYEGIYPFQVDLLTKQFMNFYSAGPHYEEWNTNLLFQQLDIAEVITKDIWCLLGRLDKSYQEEFTTLRRALRGFAKVSGVIDTCINDGEIYAPDTQLGQTEEIDLKQVVSDIFQYTINLKGSGGLERSLRGIETHAVNRRFSR